MTKRQRRLTAALVILALLLLAIVGYYGYYRATKKLMFDLTGTLGASVEPPQFLYSFSGAEGNRVIRPIGVLVDGGNVYVVDAQTGKTQVFNEAGDWKRSIGASESVTPLYIAKNPIDGNLYVSDRRTRSIHRYTTEGKYLGDFDPRLPKDQLPKFETNGAQWVPLALAFGSDGTMYVTEILNGHRLLIFDPNGKFKRSVGTAAIVLQPSEAPKVFQFPNGMMIYKDELYIADSNNRRVQVFGLDGEYRRLIVTSGLPRGIAPLRPLVSDDASSPARFVEVDTLAHDATIWTTNGEKVLSFGEQGLLDGQFNYPNNVAIGSKNRIFITDTSNARVQVWGWPDQVAGNDIIGAPRNWLWCFLPLLLLPLLFLLRKRRFFATADFVEEMVEIGESELLASVRRLRWVTTQDQFELIQQAAGNQETADLFDVWEHSEPDAQALMDKHEIGHDAAVIMSVAQRTRLFCTQDDELRVLATRMEVDVMNAQEFVRKYGKKRPGAEDG